MKLLPTLIVAMFCLFSGHAALAQSGKNIMVTEFAQKAKSSNVTIIDVRTPNEYKEGHIDKAINIDFYDQAKFEEKISAIPKDDVILVYCLSGARSAKSVALIEKSGFPEVYNLIGGYTSWKKSQN